MPLLIHRTESESNAQVRLRWLRWCWVAFGLALFATTWRLWTPQSVFPQVPLLSIGLGVPRWVDWVSIATLLASLLCVAVVQNRTWLKVVCGVYIAAMSALVIVDQHRLQPWAYQFALVAIVFSTCGGRRALSLLRLLAVGIYVFSAIGKFDYEFVHTLGQQFLTELLNFARLPDRYITPTTRLTLAFVFPISELLIAIGLAFRRSRRIGVIAAVVMHTTLLLILGPWGLKHQSAVLIWNGFFIAQAILLFWPTRRVREDESSAESTTERRSTQWLAYVGTTIIYAACLLPILEFWGKYDHWLAWGLYSPRNSRVVCYIDEAAASKLPAELQPYLVVSRDDLSLLQVRLDRWSLESLGVPIYPQDRFQVGVSLWLAKRYDLGDAIMMKHQSAASRWSGTRRNRRRRGTTEIEATSTTFTFNAAPRPNSYTPPE